MNLHRQPTPSGGPPCLPAAKRGHPLEACYAHLVFLLLPLLIVYLVVNVQFDPQGLDTLVNRTAPLYLVAVLLFSTYRIARACPEAIWSPALWLPLQSAVFFGIGPLVEVYGNDATRHALSIHPLAINEEQLFRSNTLSTFGVWLLLAGFWLHTALKRRAWRGALRPFGPAAVTIQPATLALCLIFGGAVLRYGIIKPSQWGMIDVVVPGGLTAIGAIIDVGFGIAAFSAARGNRSMRLAMFVMWPFHLFLACLSMAKVEIILAMLLPAIGAYVAHRKLWRLAVSFVVLTAVYAPLQEYIHYGRAAIHQNAGNITEASYGERVAILGRFLGGDRNRHHTDSRQGWWTRLNYSGVQAYAMDAYDADLPGSTLNNVWMYFIPRVIWPDKPVMTGPSLEFYRTVTGNRGTSFLGLPIYGDLYWQFGWTGVILGSPLIGWIFAMTSWRSIAVMRAREFIYVPVVLIALEAAFLGPTNFVIGLIGMIPIYIAFLLAIAVFVRVARRNGLTSPLSSAPPAAQRA